MPLSVDDAITFAHALADAAGPIARNYFRQKVEVFDKPDFTPVTVADREIEAQLRKMIRTQFPGHGILGEEEGRDGVDREYVWVLDPIDGTKSFISGVPLFGTLIALLRNGAPILGMADHPILRERWVGAPGAGAFYNGAPCRTRDCNRLADAILFTTSPDSFAGDDALRFDRASRRARLRRFGGDCYSYALLASGHVDVVLGGRLEPYDFMPMVALVEGAGGVMTDWAGNRLNIDDYDGKVLVSATPELHAEMLTALAV